MASPDETAAIPSICFACTFAIDHPRRHHKPANLSTVSLDEHAVELARHVGDRHVEPGGGWVEPQLVRGDDVGDGPRDPVRGVPVVEREASGGSPDRVLDAVE